jgi:hypothetical protein
MKKQLQVFFEPEELAALRQQAIADGRSMAGTLRHALREYVYIQSLRKEAKKLGKII